MCQVHAILWSCAHGKCGSGQGGRTWKEKVFQRLFTAGPHWVMSFAEQAGTARDGLVDCKLSVDFNRFKKNFMECTRARNCLSESYMKVSCVNWYLFLLLRCSTIQFGPIVLLNHAWDMNIISKLVSKLFWNTAVYVFEHMRCQPKSAGLLVSTKEDCQCAAENLKFVEN
jgi:hypothetical protein